ncbi:unnamed protein product [Chondrus crispus]|uniref:Uncharacterized protein n=1 Tax=Chondrus crispus TaxID=2769 RepID=R7QN34_CHOCR|nr:unnamed protein product [Chondrus crispus]CDF38800.1 unnamed protein product [Chondrus crispus]|eukprot:XP_005718705.1 unnamed protein product [Chondrus crispus]
MDADLFTQSADLADSVSDICVTAEDVKEALVELGATVTDGRLVDLVCGKSSGQLASMHLSGGIKYLVSKGFISHSAGGTAVSTILAGGQARAQELTSERCSRTVNVSGVIELLRQLETNDQTVFHWASKSLYEGSASVLIELTECGGPEVDERSREHLMSVRDEVRNAEEFGYEMSIGDVATATIMLVLKKNGRDRLRRAVFDIAGRYNGAEASPYYRQTLGHTLTKNRHYYGVIRAATRDKIDTPLPAKVTSTKNVEWKGEDLYEFRYGNLSVILALAVGLVLTGVVASMVNWQSDEGNRADSISAVLAAVAVLMGLVPYLVSEVSSRRSDKRMMLRGYRLVEGSTLQGDMRIHAISAAIRAGKGQHFTSQWCCLIPEHTGGRYTLDTPLTLQEWIDVGAEVVTGNTPELFIKLAGVTYALGRGSGAAMHGYVVAGRIEGVEKARVSSEGRSVSVGYTPPGRYTERRKDT